MMIPSILFILLISTVSVWTTPSRSCLDDCLCEQNENTPLIRCENGKRTTLQLPTEVMNGYEVIALPCNDIQKLPSIALLFAAFPDLKAIDVEGNANFDCSQLTDLREHLVINSDCGKPTNEHFQCSSVELNDEVCDWKCRNLEKIKELWRKLKEAVKSTVKKLDLEDKMQNVQDWFHNAFTSLKNVVNNQD